MEGSKQSSSSHAGGENGRRGLGHRGEVRATGSAAKMVSGLISTVSEEVTDFKQLFFWGGSLFIYLFIYGCVGSSFLCEGFL